MKILKRKKNTYKYKKLTLGRISSPWPCDIGEGFITSTQFVYNTARILLLLKRHIKGEYINDLDGDTSQPLKDEMKQQDRPACNVASGIRQGSYKNCNHFSRTFQGPPTKNIISYKNEHSQSILVSLQGLNCLLHQLLFIFQFTCLKLIVNYCIKHRSLYVSNL